MNCALRSFVKEILEDDLGMCNGITWDIRLQFEGCILVLTRTVTQGPVEWQKCHNRVLTVILSTQTNYIPYYLYISNQFEDFRAAHCILQ